MKKILAWSGGKDSTATGIVAKLNSIHIDQIVTVMPDPFKQELELKERFEDFMGAKVRIIPSPTYEDYFFRRKVRGKHKGTIYGFPFIAYKTCARILKWQPMKKYANSLRGEYCFLLGIAADESRNVFTPNRSLLIEHEVTESDARALCEKYGLLNPLYNYFKRLGCVRCPKQSREALLKVKKLEPEKFQWLLSHEHLSPVTFKPNRTLKEMNLGEQG